MKQLTLLLLTLIGISATAQTKTGNETKFDYGILNKSSQTVTAPTFLVTQGTDGTYGKTTEGVLTTGTQTITGAKTFSTPVFAPTATVGTNTTQVATTAFVLANGTAPDATTAVKGIVKLAGDLTGTALLPTIKPSVDLTGVPTAPTATVGTNTTQVATTAFVNTGLALKATDANVLHTTGNEVFNGIKTGINTSSISTAVVLNQTSTSNSAQGILTINKNNSNSTGLYISGSGGGNGGMLVTNAVETTSVLMSGTYNNSSGSTLDVYTAGSEINGAGIRSQTSGAMPALRLHSSLTGNLIVGNNNTVDVFTLSRSGTTTATSFIKSGATTTDALLAGGGTLANPVGGTGTSGYLSKWSGAGTQNNSGVFQSAVGNIGIGTINPLNRLDVKVTSSDGGGAIDGFSINDGQALRMGLTIGVNTDNLYSWLASTLGGVGSKPIVVNPFGGNVLIGTTVNSGDRLNVNGSIFSTKYNVTTGANASANVVTLVGGTATINTTAATPNSLIFLTRKTSGGTIGFESYSTTTGSFTITSVSALDTSTFSYLIIN